MSGLPIRRVESHLVGGGGRSLFRRAWLPAEAERVLVLVHGYAEHSGRYDHLGAWLAARGCAVHGYDQVGHGRSDGVRGHVRRFGDFLDDLDAVLAEARGAHPGVPAVVVGHSMGGLVAASWAVERGADLQGTAAAAQRASDAEGRAASERGRAPAITGVVTSGAALSVTGVPSRGQLLLMRLLRRVMPRLTMEQAIDPTTLSRDPEVGRAYVADPLVFQRMTVSLAAELFDAGARTLPLAGQVRVPMLLLHGEEDRLCPASGSRSFFEQLTTPGSDLRVYPELRHEIFNEPEQEQVFADVLDWIRKREADR